jgi:hypothetical protein
VLVGGTAAISVVLGALAGRSLTHSLAIGFYLVGALVLIGSLALGSRGPMRADRIVEEDRPVALGGFMGLARVPLGRRSLRKASPEERSESRRASLGLFVLGLLLIMLGTAFDPTRHAF